MALPKVLLIEDNAWDIELIRIMLAKELGPHHLDVLQDGEAALEFVRGHRVAPANTNPCVIVLDLRLPRHDGLAVMEEVRRSPTLSHIQVIVLSSFVSEAEKEEVERLGGIFKEKPNELNAFETLANLIAGVCRGGLEPVVNRA